MQKTLLEIVQNTLSSMDSDAVDTIFETVESEQIALSAQEQYMELATYQHVPQFEQLTQLIGFSDKETRTLMKIPENATDIKCVRYKHTLSNGKSEFKEIRFLDKEDFLSRQLTLKVGDDNVDENVMEGNIRVPYRDDKGPEYWTTFDDEVLVFDSIDTVIQGDSTLHNDNSLVIAYIIPEFELKDDFIPDLPVKLIPQYLNMVKEVNTYEHRQIDPAIRTRNGERQGHRNRHFASIADHTDTRQGARGSNRQGRGRQYGRGRYGANSGGPTFR